MSPLEPSSFTTAKNLLGSSAGGMQASTLEVMVVINPRMASRNATGFPPGMRITSGPAGSPCKRITEENMYKNGRK